MKKEKKEDSFIKQPYYKGGEKALKLFISENLKYPASSQSNKIEGDVHIRYDINFKGDVSDTKVIAGLDDACNEEAIRVVKMLKYIVPKTPRNLKVVFHKNIRIHFALHPEKVTKTNSSPPLQSLPIQQFNYTVITKNKETPNSSNTKVTYSYSLKVN